MEMIRLENVAKNYGRIKALKNISFCVSEGEIVGCIGPNGSGKTTTIKAITGLCRVRSGAITVLGVNALTQYEKVGKKIGVVFENHGLYAELTVWENLEFYARLAGGPANLRRQEIEKGLELSGLGDRSRSPARTLSKGMARRLAIARALLIRPQILILDEPLDGIDVASRISIADLLKTWVEEPAHCILLTSHNMPEVEQLCNKVTIVRQGEVLASGPMEALRNGSGKDVFEITLARESERPLAERILNDCQEIQSLTGAGVRLLVVVDRKEVAHIAARLHENGVAFEEIHRIRESLSDIYLKVVGDHE
jgi:ABC-2 type transport system ATP-binding protein